MHPIPEHVSLDFLGRLLLRGQLGISWAFIRNYLGTLLEFAMEWLGGLYIGTPT